jgi:hypothetical protein
MAPISASASAIWSAAKATGSAWKLPPETISPALRLDQRIVGDGVGLDLQRPPGLVEQVEAGAGHLRVAADAVGVLHPVVALAVAFADLRAVQQPAHGGGDGDLARLTAQAVDLGAQRRGGAHDRVGRQRGGERAALGDAPRLEQPGQRPGGRELRAVDQRQPFLGPERHRRQPRRRQRVAAGQAAPADLRLALADHRRRHMRQRRQIARRADRALRGDHGRHAAASMSSISAITAQRTPEAPRPSDSSFSAIISRTMAAGQGSPTPAQCERIRLRAASPCPPPRRGRWPAFRSRC